MSADRVRAGVIGAGSMGRNHVRAYDELATAELAGVHDVDSERAERVASEYETRALSFAELLSAADVVTVAVPTEYHFQAVRECIDAGVDVLVEKPFVEHVDRGRSLLEYADERDVTVQVGQIERFNPAVRELFTLLPDVEIRAVEARRLGPPPDRAIDDSVVMDLMIHDIDLLLQILDEPAEVAAASTGDGEYATATIRSESGAIGTLTASRVTQEKIRELVISGADRKIEVDFIDQSIEICRRSVPEYVRDTGSVNYRHETVVENLVVERHEPLKEELSSFISAVRGDEEPLVTGEDGLRAVELAQRIDGIGTPAEEFEIERTV